MTKNDPTLAQIAARFTRHDVEKSGGGYMIVDPPHLEPCCSAVAHSKHRSLRTLYWSNVKGRWTTFGNFGRMKLMLESAHEIIENDPMFRIPPSR